MKTLNYLTFLVLFLGITTGANGQIRRTVHGNGNVIKKERTAGSFSGVKASTGIDVYLSQGDNMSIVVEADENLHEYIKTEIINGTLDIFSEVNIRDAEMKRVFVTIKEIVSVSAASAGDVIGETPVKTEKLKLSASSAGDIKLEAYAKNIDINVSSSGDITLSGAADMMDADLSSAGDLNAFNLKVREASISVSSAGDADIYVTERLTASASSAGDVNYKGDPEYIDVHSSSAGGVRKR